MTEVLSHAKLNESEISRIKIYLESIHIISTDYRIAEAAADFRRRYGVSTTDSIIVASAYLHGMRLATRDKKMQKVKEVTFVQI